MANEHVKHTKRQISMLSNKMGCNRRTNVDLDRVFIVPIDWSTDDACTIKQSLSKGT